MDYDDFALQITSGPEGGFVVRVTGSPAGQAESPFEVPVDGGELSALRDLGDRLFQALFSGPIRGRLDESLGRLYDAENRGLRLRLQMSLDDPGLARLESLPWEYLYRAEKGTFLGLGSEVAIVRSPCLPLGGERAPAALPVRVLTFAGDPGGWRPLDVGGESRAIERIWSTSGIARVRPLGQRTLDDLRLAVREQRPHVLHLMGHAGFDPETGCGAIVLTGANGKRALVDGSLLADQLRDASSLRLVFLNACETARFAAANPFASMANALLQAGIPAVLAMQFPISDSAALAFSTQVYRQLARGEPIETAVAEGRLAIRREHPSSLEWGIPVLFLRASEGHLFAHPREPRREPVVRRLRTGLAGGLGAFALGSLAIGWSLQNRVPSDSPGARVEGLHAAMTDVRQKPIETPPVKADRTAEGLPSPRPRARSEPGSRAKDAAGPRTGSEVSRISPVPATHRVRAGNPVELPEVGAELSVQFMDELGEREVRLFLSPSRGNASGSPPLLGPDTVTFDTAGGKVAVDLVDIDWAGQSVVVRARSQTG